MYYSSEVKTQANKMRAQGLSLKEISDKIHIAKSTASLWTSEVNISLAGKRRLLNQQIKGRTKALKVIESNRNKVKAKIVKRAIRSVNNIKLTRDLCKLLISIFIWTEGQKWSKNILGFINSDPLMISTFLKLLRAAFNLDESKFRALVHIHEYHDEKETIKFWSKVTKIPIQQFTKSYLKTNTSIRKRDDYKGCIRINYYDYKVAQELSCIYNTFANNIRL